MELKSYDWLVVRYCDGPFGWSGIVNDLLEEIDGVVEGTSAKVHVLQIKEKWGSLRFYYQVVGGPACLINAIDKRIESATRRSSGACITCGEPGDMVEVNGWVKTLCDRHKEDKVH